MLDIARNLLTPTDPHLVLIYFPLTFRSTLKGVFKEFSKKRRNADALLKRHIEVLHLPDAPQRSVMSLLNWINGKGNIVCRETDFLQTQDLCAVGGGDHQGIAWMISLVERVFIHS